MKKVFNTIERAEREFGFKVDMENSLQEVWEGAENCIRENVDYDYISVCETNKSYDYIYWNDGKGYTYEADGEFISGSDRNNTFFRKDDKGNFYKIDWFERDENVQDYVLMEYVIDSDGLMVALVAE